MSEIRETDRHAHNPLVRYFANLGPGLVTGASDDDPSRMTTYSVAGAALGYGLLWTAPATFPLMAAVQPICARIGLVTGAGLPPRSASTIRARSSMARVSCCWPSTSSASRPTSPAWPT